MFKDRILQTRETNEDLVFRNNSQLQDWLFGKILVGTQQVHLTT